MGFLLRKARHGQYLDAFRMKPVRTNYFKNKLELSLNTVLTRYHNNEIKFDDMHIDTEEDAVVVLDVDRYQTVRLTIEHIFQQAEANELDSLKSVTGAKFSAMLFGIPNNNSVIAIDSVSIYNKTVFEKGQLVATYDDVSLQELKEDSVLIFEYGLPCIYFEKMRKLLVLDKQKTEKIFNLLEYYRKNAQTKFDELVDEELVEINNVMLNLELSNITTARKINNMVRTDSFTKNIDYYKEYEKRSTDFDDDQAKITIKNDKVIINTKDDLRSFLYITREDILESIMDPDRKFLAFKKRPIRRKQDQTATG